MLGWDSGRAYKKGGSTVIFGAEFVWDRELTVLGKSGSESRGKDPYKRSVVDGSLIEEFAVGSAEVGRCPDLDMIVTEIGEDGRRKRSSEYFPYADSGVRGILSHGAQWLDPKFAGKSVMEIGRELEGRRS